MYTKHANRATGMDYFLDPWVNLIVRHNLSFSRLIIHSDSTPIEFGYVSYFFALKAAIIISTHL